MARAEITEIVIDTEGRPLPGASVQVNIRGSTPATVYEAETGGATVTNPIVTNQYGRIEAWLDTGSYDLVVEGYTQPFEALSASAAASEDVARSFDKAQTFELGTVFVEQANPSAPAADQAALYARDDGAGKTELVARFATGAVQGIASQATRFATVASAATIAIPAMARVVEITGTTAITSITAREAGYVVTLIFRGTLTFTDGSNLKIAGNLSAAANSAITLVCDGTNWYDTGRATNG